MKSKPPNQFGLTKIGQAGKITIENKTESAVFIGHGRFSNAYFTQKHDIVIFTHYGDATKSLLCDLAEVTRNQHIPRIRRITQIETGAKKAVCVYRMPFYNPLRSTSDKTAKSYKQLMIALELQQLKKYHFWEISQGENIINNGKCLDINRAIVDNFTGSKSVKMALTMIVERAADYGDNFLFDDFSFSNLGLDKNDNLVLLDTMFDAELIKDYLDRKRRRVKRRVNKK